MATDTLLVNLGIGLIGIAALEFVLSLFVLYGDARQTRDTKRLGRYSHWYHRPTALLGIGMMLLSVTIMLFGSAEILQNSAYRLVVFPIVVVLACFAIFLLVRSILLRFKLARNKA